MPRVKRIVLILVTIVAVLGAVALRVVLEGRAALARGDDAMEHDRALDAIRAYEAAARWYLPFAPHVDTAYDRLRAVTTASEPGLRLAAWRAIRSAARVTRSAWTPHRADLAAADAAIAELSAQMPTSTPAGETTAAREAWYRSRLARDARAKPEAAALAGFGIILWLIGGYVLARRGVSASGRLIRSPALVGGLMILVGVACWSIGLYNA
jgi:hypothetical protein